MSAAIDECVQPAILAAVDDNRGLAHEGGLEITRIAHLRFQRHVIPHWPAKQTFLLQCVNRRIEKNPVGNPRYTFGGPSNLAVRFRVEGRHVRSSFSTDPGWHMAPPRAARGGDSHTL